MCVGGCVGYVEGVCICACDVCGVCVWHVCVYGVCVHSPLTSRFPMEKSLNLVSLTHTLTHSSQVGTPVFLLGSLVSTKPVIFFCSQLCVELGVEARGHPPGQGSRKPTCPYTTHILTSFMDNTGRMLTSVRPTTLFLKWFCDADKEKG